MKSLIAILSCAAALAVSQSANAQYASGQNPEAGDWEFRIGPIFVNSQSVGFKGGTTANIKSNTGLKGGAAWYLNSNLALGGNFSYSRGDFDASVNPGTGSGVVVEN